MTSPALVVLFLAHAKVYYHGEDEFSEPHHPPPYSSEPHVESHGSFQYGSQDHSYGASVSVVQGPSVITTQVGVGTNVGVYGDQVGYVGTNVGVYGNQVGVVGTNVGVYGNQVGVVGTNVGVVGTNVGVVGVPVIITQQISPKPTRLTCKSCNIEITTRVESKATWKTHFFACILCLMGCWCCVCIPYCTDSCLNSDHYCPNCNAYIASYVT